MSTNVFKETRSNIPQNDPKISRIEFDKSDIGARKSHTKGLAAKNSYTIQHVGSK
jgi:hypothetical protein